MAIFEGIHALNDTFSQIAPSAFRLYISARSNVEQDGTLLFKGTWMRLCRRVVRDHQFRGTSPADTLQMWANVRRGEKQYISPYKEKADLMFDSSFMCEVSVMKSPGGRTGTRSLPASSPPCRNLRPLTRPWYRVPASSGNLSAAEAISIKTKKKGAERHELCRIF